MTQSIDSFHLDRFKRFITDALGFPLEDDAAVSLDALLRDRLRASSHAKADAYLEGLRDPILRQREIGAIAQRLTIGETYFFRVPEHFDALAEVALPDRLRSRQAPTPLRILSAGCASGEEAYTIAMLMRERFPEIPPSEVAIAGMDVNPAFLSNARQARFSSWSLRSLAPDRRARYFREQNHSFHLDPDLATAVTFTERNLLADAPAWENEAFDVIFCRNVLIYFSPDACRKALDNLTRALAPGGYLFLGPAESLRGISRAFRLIHSHETFYYQKKPDASVVPAVSASAASALAASAPDASPWVDTVTRASARIARLANRNGRLEGTPSTDRTGEAAWSLTSALERFKQERFAEALDALKALPPEAGGDPEVLLLQAAILTNAGDRPEAERLCRQILALDEFSAGAHYLLALCREQADDLEAAKRHNETAAYLDPAFAMPRLHLGLLAIRGGQLPQARRELERAQVLLSREEESRILLYGGGFNREALMGLCAAEIRRCKEAT